MYLSFQYDEWLMPSDIVIQLYLKFFLKISEDIKADVKKAMYHMVTQLNDDKMPLKIVY